MLTIEKLVEYGADTETGLKRCVNSEALYLRLVNTVPDHKSFAALDEAIAQGDLDKAFQEAHGLKGVLTNLALTPLSDPIVKITDHLRAKESMNYIPLLDIIHEQLEKLTKICKD